MRTKFLRHLGAMVLLLLAALGAQAQISTADKFVVSDYGYDDDMGNYFMVGLEGAHTYCAYNMTIQLPRCLSYYVEDGDIGVIMNKDKNFYPQKFGDYYHTVLGALQTDPKLAKVACTSNNNSDFKKTSGDLFYVLYNYNAWAKAGANEIRMTGLNLTAKELVDDKYVIVKYIPEGDLNTGTINIPAEGREVSVNISPNSRLTTCILPFDKADIPEGVTAYEAGELVDGALNLNPVEVMRAYKPYILYAESGYAGTWSGIADGDAFPESAVVNVGGLCGVIEQTAVTEGYILQDKGDGPKFYKIGSTPYSLKAGKCYLSKVSGAALLSMRFNDINAIKEAQAEEPSDKQAYNLAGQRVSSTAPAAIYIIKGKKIVKNL